MIGWCTCVEYFALWLRWFHPLDVVTVYGVGIDTFELFSFALIFIVSLDYQ